MKREPKDISGIENQVVVNVRQAYEKGYKAGYEAGYEDSRKETLELDNRARDIGRDEAWECIRKISNLSADACEKLFNGKSWIYDFSVSEVMIRLQEYEERQKQIKRNCENCEYNESTLCHWHCQNKSHWKLKDEIKIGDEVQSNYEGGDKYIVTALECINNPNCYACLGGKKVLKTEVHRTGKTFPQIVEILEQLKDGDDE